jgi:hypothetical protein
MLLGQDLNLLHSHTFKDAYGTSIAKKTDGTFAVGFSNSKIAVFTIASNRVYF